MALWSIPIKFNSPDFKFQIELDGTVFGFRFVYNERVDGWAMEIQDSLGNALVSGLRVVSNWRPIARFQDPALPLGNLFTMDVTGMDNEPTQVNFGDTILLCYDEALS